MTREEKLEAIAAKCRELLALAEKRTPGKWYAWPTMWFGGRDGIKYDGSNCPWINAEGAHDIARVNPRGTAIYREPEIMANGAYIAACAGAAEAGWRATLAAIEGLFIMQPGANRTVISNQIIAAWEGQYE